MLSLDLAARRVAMASLIYYSLDDNVMTDAEYDDLAKRCAGGWKELSRERRFLLVKPEDIFASGFGCRITVACMSGSYAWLESLGKTHGRKLITTTKPKTSKIVGQWWPCGEFAWE